MNSFGLNSAALNASVANVVLGAALFAATGAFAATPTRTTFAESSVATSTSGLTAAGVRVALGTAQLAGELTTSADGIIAITSSAFAHGRGTFSASYTEAYAVSSFVASAQGTITQPGAATSTATLTATAVGKRTAYVAAEAQGAFTGRFDASVKRAGSQYTERDGYVLPVEIAASFSAAGVRTALPEAQVMGVADFVCTGSTHIQAGAAVARGTLDITAIPAIDGCYSPFTFTFTAQPLLTQAGASQVAMSSDLSAVATVLTTEVVLPAEATSDFIAVGRLALRGNARFSSESDMSADARLAERGEASMLAQLSVDAAPWIYRPARADYVMGSHFQAAGVRIYNGAATLPGRLAFTALAIVNPTVPAPSTRSMRVPAQVRATRVPAQNRTMRVRA